MTKAKSGGKRGLVIALLALVVVLSAGFYAYGSLADNAADGQGSSSRGEGTPSGYEGSGVPLLSDFNPTVYSEDGSAYSFIDIADGKPLIVNFWATWCPYCVQEMSDYQKLYQEYGDRVSFAFVDIADGQRETVDDGATWLKDNGYDLPAYYDTTLEAMYAYGATNLPTTAIASSDGFILDVSAGAINYDSMCQTIDGLLEA